MYQLDSIAPYVFSLVYFRIITSQTLMKSNLHISTDFKFVVFISSLIKKKGGGVVMTAFVLHLMRFSEVCGKDPRGCDLIKIKSRPIVYTVYMTVYREIVNNCSIESSEKYLLVNIYLRNVFKKFVRSLIDWYLSVFFAHKLN